MEKHLSKSILDPTFRYVPSHETDIRKTFARVRKEMANTYGASIATKPNVVAAQRKLNTLLADAVDAKVIAIRNATIRG